MRAVFSMFLLAGCQVTIDGTRPAGDDCVMETTPNHAVRYDCAAGSCALACDGPDCQMGCAGGNCEIECDGDSCDVECAGGGCQVTCRAEDVSCAGDNCQVTCAGADSCVIDTCNTGCMLDCGSADTCDNDCGVAQGCATF